MGESDRALQALTRLAKQLGEWAEHARTAGRVAEASILEANRAMAEDPVLRDQVAALAAADTAESAIREATRRHAQVLEALPDAELAARGADVRELGHRAARMLAGEQILPRKSERIVVFARDLGPGDLVELRLAGNRVAGIALADGATTSHIAIMARALDVPVVVGLGDELLTTSDGEGVLLDGDNGVLTLAPEHDLRGRTKAVVRRRARVPRLSTTDGQPRSVLADGRRIRLLCNASSSTEVRAALAAGAEGVGLLRTEFAFLQASSWPAERQHVAALKAPLAALAQRVATIRTLDFGFDKTPPFLMGTPQRGLALTLTNPLALRAQVRGIASAGRMSRLRILFPVVESAGDFLEARAIVADALDEVGWKGSPPDVGAMIETPRGVACADEIARVADFVSLGTNDLARFARTVVDDASLTPSAAADPEVLRFVSLVVQAAHAHGIPACVCGEAAGESDLVPLFVGLGVDELSVSPAKLERVRLVLPRLTFGSVEALAAAALEAASLDVVLALSQTLLESAEGRDEGGQASDGFGGVVTDSEQ